MSSNRYSHGIHAHAQVHVHDTTDVRADELSSGRIVVHLGPTCDLFFDSYDAVARFCRVVKRKASWIPFAAAPTTDNRGDDEGDPPRGEYLPPDESVQPPTQDELPVDAKTMIDIGYVRGIPGANYCASGLWQPPDQATLPLLEDAFDA